MGHFQKWHCLSGDKPAPLSSTPPRERTNCAGTHSFTASRGKHHPSTNILKKGRSDPFLRGVFPSAPRCILQELLFKMRLRTKVKLGVANICGAKNRQGNPCQCKRLFRGNKCRFHGGLSTGPKTAAGRRAIAMATRQRMASGQQERALAGFYAWLDEGGRQTLSRYAAARERRKRTHRAGVGASWSLRVA